MKSADVRKLFYIHCYKKFIMENYLVKKKTSDDTFYVYYDKKLGVYYSILENYLYHKEDIIIIRKL